MAWGRRDVQFRLEYAGFRVAAALFSVLPLETASALGGRSWRLIAPLLSRHKRAVVQLQAAFPGKSRAECDAIARDMWEVMGRTFGEFFHIDEFPGAGRFTIETPELLAALEKSPQGFVIGGLHQGNWEISVMGVPARAHGVAGVYQRIKNPLVDQWVWRKREKFYPGGLLEKGSKTALQLIRHVRRGGGVAVLADLRENGGVRVPFFGRDAPSTPFPAMLARSWDVPLYAGTVVREPGVRFRMRLDPVEVPVTADKEADIAQATANLAAAFEASIRARPEQWMWAHRRWG